MSDKDSLREQLERYEKDNEELKLKVEELTDFFENASIPLHWVDGDGIIIWANQAELDLLGYTIEEYVGFPISDFHADPEVIDDILTRLTNNETLINYTAKLKCKDGSVKHVLINSNVLRKKGEFVHTRCFTRDITATVQEEERRKVLLHILEQQTAVIDSSSDAIISKTLTGVITSWNASAERLFGYKRAEIIGESIFKLIPAGQHDEEEHILFRLRDGNRVEHFETKRLCKSGKLRDVSLTISPIKDLNGNITGLSSIAHDITEKKGEERRKDDFMAMISHELKTPLTTINAYVQLLMENLKTEDRNFSLQALPRIEAQAKKMILMVHDFLSLSRLEDGMIPLRMEKFGLQPLVAEIAGDAILLGVMHTITFSSCEETIVHADRDKIGQVLMNLASNAIKYSPPGGTISIRCQKESGHVRISVSDEGIGISEADQKRLFERYYRVNDTRSKGATGFGIGLYIVSEILRQHGSQIMVESHEGKGSTFYFKLAITA